MKHPTALIVYNRPRHLERVMASLGVLRPEPLYIFCDGGKNQDDWKRVIEAREIVLHSIDWTTPVTVVRGVNVGLATSVVSAVDFVLERHETVIVLEDDCVPGTQFYNYMDECLDRYAGFEKVLSVTGYTVPIADDILSGWPWDVYFYPRLGSWGWGTWRRAWALYERDAEEGLAEVERKKANLVRGGPDIPALVKMRADGELDAWTPGMFLATALANAYHVYPTMSHVQNIGMDRSGTHCGVSGKYETTIARRRPTRFPDNVIVHQPFIDNLRRYF